MLQKIFRQQLYIRHGITTWKCILLVGINMFFFSCPRHLLCWLFEHMWLWELEELPHTVLEIVQYFQKQYKNSHPVQRYVVISHHTVVRTPEQT